MAIIIPSKNIYNISNDKVIDNKISSVSIETTNVSKNNEYSTPVIRHSITDITISNTETNPYVKNFTSTSTGTASASYAFAYHKDEASYYKVKIVFPIKNIANGYISKLYRDEGDIVEVQYYGDVATYGTQATVTIYPDETDPQFEMSTINAQLINAKENISIDLPEMPLKTTITHPNIYAPPLTATVDGLSNKTNISAKIDDGDIIIDFKSIVKLITTSLTGVDDTFSLSVKRSTLKGTRTIYIIKEIFITIYGNTVGIKIDDSTKEFGTQGGNTFKISRNEFLQPTQFDNSIVTKLADRILSEYENGKETAVIKCSISEYYDTDKLLAISTKKRNTDVSAYYDSLNYSIGDGYVTIYFNEPLPCDCYVHYTYKNFESLPYEDIAEASKGLQDIQITIDDPDNNFVSYDNLTAKDGNIPMVFENGDSVIPYIKAVNGEDVPMSVDSNNNPKVFRVVGTKVFYDGAVWQELTLQEI